MRTPLPSKLQPNDSAQRSSVRARTLGKRLTPQEKQWREISEKAFQKQIMDLARMYGWRVAHFSDSRKQVKPGVFVGDADAAGFPDLFLIRPPEILVIEVKKELGKTTDIQEEWLADFRACGIEAFVARPSTFDEILARLTKSRPKG
jgi:VRR-NUC domain